MGLPGTVDSSPIYLARRARERAHARPARDDHHLRPHARARRRAAARCSGPSRPSSYSSWRARPQITTATPVADPSGRYVYAASPDGLHPQAARGRTAARCAPAPGRRRSRATPTHEKIASALNLDGRYVLVTTGGYIGDAPPYQGKVLRDRPQQRTGRRTCSTRSAPTGAGSSTRAAARRRSRRSGAAPARWWTRRHTTSTPPRATGRSTAARTGATPCSSSRRAWAGCWRHYTPPNQRAARGPGRRPRLHEPALLPDPSGGSATRYLLQGGKDGAAAAAVRLLELLGRERRGRAAARRRAADAAAARRRPTMFTAPAVLHRRGLTEAFVATGARHRRLQAGGGRLQVAWQNGSRRHEPAARRRPALGLRPVRRPRRLPAGKRPPGPPLRRSRAAIGTARSSPAGASTSRVATRTSTRTTGVLSIFHA